MYQTVHAETGTRKAIDNWHAGEKSQKCITAINRSRKLSHPTGKICTTQRRTCTYIGGYRTAYYT